MSCDWTGGGPLPQIIVLLILKLGCSASQISHDQVIDLSLDLAVWLFLHKVAILLELVACILMEVEIELSLSMKGQLDQRFT